MAFFPIIKTILTSLVRKESTLAYPYKPMPKAPLVRGQISIEVEKCIFCGICSMKCPTHAIAVDKNAKTWEISRFGCIVCGECAAVCPKKCLHMLSELTPASGEMNKDKSAATTVAPTVAVPADA